MATSSSSSIKLKRSFVRLLFSAVAVSAIWIIGANVVHPGWAAFGGYAIGLLYMWTQMMLME